MELIRNEYSKQIEEKAILIQQKSDRDKKIATNEMLSLRLKDLRIKLEAKIRKKSSLEAQIQNLSNETGLQELVKKKAYLESSLTYLDEKYNILKVQADEAAMKVKENDTNYNILKKTVTEKLNEIETLKQTELKVFGELLRSVLI